MVTLRNTVIGWFRLVGVTNIAAHEDASGGTGGAGGGDRSGYHVPCALA